MTIIIAVFIALLLQLAPVTTAAQSAPAAPARASALFESSDILEVALRADLRTLFRDRDSTRRVEHPATIVIADGNGGTMSVPLTLRTRGHWRRQSSNCTTPPLRMRFRGRGARGSPFEGQRDLKLVVQCRDRGEYEQYLLKEYLAYRTYSLLTDKSYRARLLRVTWEDTTGRSSLPQQYAFLIESDRDMSARLGGEILEQKGAVDADLDQEQTALMDLFQYFIGNTDYSINGLHNIRLFWFRDDRRPFPIAFDFDWTGLVEARYAFPDHRLPIKHIRTRLYRGMCQSPDGLEQAIALFRERREAIETLWKTAPGLDDRSRQRTLDYFNEFYRTVENRGALTREMRGACRT